MRSRRKGRGSRSVIAARAAAPGQQAAVGFVSAVAVAAAMLTVGGGCSRDETVATFAPVLLSFAAIDPTGTPISTSADGGRVPISPRVTFVARFDRLLDGDELETVDDAGVATGLPGVVAISPAGPSAQVSYVPNGDATWNLVFPPGPALTISPSPTLPSAATVTLTLDHSKLRSKAGEPFSVAGDASDTISFDTLPFTATFGPSAIETDGGAPALPRTTPITIVFSNLTAGDVVAHIHVAVIDGAGAAITGGALDPIAGMDDPATFIVAPQGGSWPAGATVSVDLDVGAKDALGVPLATAQNATFTVEP